MSLVRRGRNDKHPGQARCERVWFAVMACLRKLRCLSGNFSEEPFLPLTQRPDKNPQVV